MSNARHASKCEGPPRSRDRELGPGSASAPGDLAEAPMKAHWSTKEGPERLGVTRSRQTGVAMSRSGGPSSAMTIMTFTERDRAPVVTSTSGCSPKTDAAQILAWVEMDRIAIRHVFEDIDYGGEDVLDHAHWPSPWPESPRSRRWLPSLRVVWERSSLRVGLAAAGVRATLRARPPAGTDRAGSWALPG